jgi:hypothetical protein
MRHCCFALQLEHKQPLFSQAHKPEVASMNFTPMNAMHLIGFRMNV